MSELKHLFETDTITVSDIDESDFDRTIDMNKSGEYLIYSTKHTISGNQSYKVELTLAKLGSLTKGKTA